MSLFAPIRTSLGAVPRRLGWRAREAVAIIVGAIATLAIVVNALFLQPGPHPAPFFKSSSFSFAAPAETTSTVALPRARPPELTGSKVELQATPRSSAEVGKPPRSPASVPPRSDAIADLLGQSKRVMALQRALAQFGYGQIKPTGVLDADTRAAIEKLERDHKLPVTGVPSDRLAHELAVATGRSID